MQSHPLVQANVPIRDQTSARNAARNAHVADVHFPGSVLAHFLELRGRRVIKACGSLWYEVPGRFMMSLPYQGLLNPDPRELDAMLRQSGLIGVRFPSTQWTEQKQHRKWYPSETISVDISGRTRWLAMRAAIFCRLRGRQRANSGRR